MVSATPEPDQAAHRHLLGHRLHHVGAELQHALGIAEQLEALRRQGRAALLPVEQLDAQLVLEDRDARRDRRLGGVELVGRGAEAAELGDPDEGLEIAQVDHGAVFPLTATLGSKIIRKSSTR